MKLGKVGRILFLHSANKAMLVKKIKDLLSHTMVRNPYFGKGGFLRGNAKLKKKLSKRKLSLLLSNKFLR